MSNPIQPMEVGLMTAQELVEEMKDAFVRYYATPEGSRRIVIVRLTNLVDEVESRLKAHEKILLSLLRSEG